MKDGILEKSIILFSERAGKMKDLEVIIAKYYFPNELFVGQVKEIIKLLTEGLAGHFPHDQAVSKANLIVAKYYLNISEA